jgi:hypothetical protein
VYRNNKHANGSRMGQVATIVKGSSCRWKPASHAIAGMQSLLQYWRTLGWICRFVSACARRSCRPPKSLWNQTKTAQRGLRLEDQGIHIPRWSAPMPTSGMLGVILSQSVQLRRGEASLPESLPIAAWAVALFVDSSRLVCRCGAGFQPVV